MVGHYLIPSGRWYALRVTEVMPADEPGHLRVFADRVDLDSRRQPRETNVHRGHQITVRHAAKGLLRERGNDWLTGPRYWRVRAVGQMALF